MVSFVFLVPAFGLPTLKLTAETPPGLLALQQVKTVFGIALENHDLTQPCADCSPQQLLGNPAAPYLNLDNARQFQLSVVHRDAARIRVAFGQRRDDNDVLGPGWRFVSDSGFGRSRSPNRRVVGCQQWRVRPVQRDIF